MDMSPREYQDYVKNLQKKSPLLKDMALAFAIGGAICVIGQLILNGWLMLLPQDDAATATSVSLVFLSALFTGLNLYNKLARFGGAGTLVPSSAEPERWCPSRALPTPWRLRPSTSGQRAWSQAWRRKCSSSRGR